MESTPSYQKIINLLAESYWMHIDKCLLANPHLVKTAPGFLISPEKVILYLGKTHLGIEYIGPERVDKNPDELKISIQVIDLYDSEDSFLEKIIGFIYDDGASNIGTMPIPTFSEGLILPTNRGADKLEELKWHINAQDGMTIFNPTHPIVSKNEFTRIINGLFFDANEKGLLTRHIKWIDFIPVINSDIEDKKEMLKVDLSVYNKNLAEQDCNYHYPLPDDYDYQSSKLQKINRFLQLVGNNDSTEVQITQFLAQSENQFILKMRFGAMSIHSELMCEWQNEDKLSIKPDFFIVNSNGLADIVEFKLPTTEIKLVGNQNRETLSAQINSYLAQTRTYRNYFEDTLNRNWFEKKFGFPVYRPRRYLIIGRRWQIASDDWKQIKEITSEHQDVEILTYDDLIDSVVAQLYN